MSSSLSTFNLLRNTAGKVRNLKVSSRRQLASIWNDGLAAERICVRNEFNQLSPGASRWGGFLPAASKLTDRYDVVSSSIRKMAALNDSGP